MTERGSQALSVRYEVVPYTRGAVLDIGCGKQKAFPHFIAVDTEEGASVKVTDCADLQAHVEDASCDAIFSSFLLDSLDAAKALRSWWQTLKVDGHLCLHLPRRPDGRFDPDDVVALMRNIGGWELLVNDAREDKTFLQVYRKREGHEQVMSYRHKPEGKTACIVRYGGFGDMLQTANILPELKRQGYRVILNCHPSSKEILLHDPHVDEWFIQDRDQVPNHDLWEYWSVWKTKFDKYINLSSSVEDTLLARPGSPAHMWPHEVRHKYLNRNYLEFTAELAGVPYASEARFYATAEETAKARAFLRADDPFNEAFTILWTLSGSSGHKFYPWQDVVIERALKEFRHVRVILAGDEACKILEAGWENHPRVACTSGELGIRQTLALAQVADMVVGPETGVLNAVAFEDVPKLVFLSHSSAENLTKHWKNTTALASEKTPCYPCHQLHVTMRYCPQDAESGAAMCQTTIDPEDALGAIRWSYALATTKREGVAA